MIAVRSQPKLPEDPQQHLMDYFGNMRSPLWDELEDLQDENSQITEELPRLNRRIADLEEELAAAQRRTRAVEVFKAADLGSLGMKAINQKLIGDAKAKFDVDHKMTQD